MWLGILKRLASKGLIRAEEIRNLEGSCCTSTQLVLDFDFIKNGVCKLLKLQTPKSADFLYYSKATNSLYFIEMKDLTSTMNEINNRNFADIGEVNDFLWAKLESFGIHNKIFDSYIVSMLALSAIGLDNKKYKNYFNKENLNIHFILLVKASSTDYVKFRTSILALLNRYSFRAFSSPQVNLIRSEDLDTLISGL